MSADNPLARARAAASARPAAQTHATQGAQPRWNGHAANQRRTEAARRLPPMPCGCRDPFTMKHREGRCRYRGGRS
ncbi:hypothetical protein [Micromonospora sp. NPDC049662]|uniref:hypothetical protein n=1 Tax=Micromonospora sp. NPDC049662 TaxID=3155397 RepID=UPI003445119F